jgi:glycolate oxidase iron-sulfur subunit
MGRPKAAQVSALARDVSEVMADLGLGADEPKGRPTVAYHAACSMQHGQKVIEAPKRLLRDAGFVVKDVPEGHLCCGSAGTYNRCCSPTSRPACATARWPTSRACSPT